MEFEQIKKDMSDLPHLSEERIDQILKFFQDLGFSEFENYPGGMEFANGFKRVSLLQTEGLHFSTSSSTISPFITQETQKK